MNDPELTQLLRDLRVAPPDNGFEQRLHANLAAEPPPLAARRAPGVARLRRGLVPLAVAGGSLLAFGAAAALGGGWLKSKEMVHPTDERAAPIEAATPPTKGRPTAAPRNPSPSAPPAAEPREVPSLAEPPSERPSSVELHPAPKAKTLHRPQPALELSAPQRSGDALASGELLNEPKEREQRLSPPGSVRRLELDARPVPVSSATPDVGVRERNRPARTIGPEERRREIERSVEQARDVARQRRNRANGAPRDRGTDLERRMPDRRVEPRRQEERPDRGRIENRRR